MHRSLLHSGSLRSVTVAFVMCTALVAGAPASADDDTPYADPAHRSVDETSLAASSEDSLTVVVVAPLVGPPSTTGRYTAAELAEYTDESGVLTARLDALENHGLVLAVDPMIVASILLLGDAAPSSATTWLDRLDGEPDVLPLLWADADASYAAAATDELPDPGGFPSSGDDAAADPALWDWSGPPLVWPRAGTASRALLKAASRTEPVLLSTDDVTPAPPPQADGNDGDAGGDPAETTDPPSADPPSADPTDSAETTAPATPTEPTQPLEPVEPQLPLSARSHVGKSPVYLALGDESALLEGAASGFSSSQRDGKLRQLRRSLRGVAGEAPGGTVLLALGRNVDYNDEALGTAIDQISALDAVTLGAWSDVETASDRVAVRLQRHRLLADRVAQFRRLAAGIDRVELEASALIDPDPVMRDVRLQAIAQMGNSWLHDPAWADSLAGYENLVSTLSNAVSIEPASDALVIAESVNLPVTISNLFPGPVRVVVGVTADSDRLIIEQPVELEIEAQSQRSAEVRIRAIANGNAQLTIHLSAVDSTPLDSPQVVRVDIQAGWETVGASTLVGVVLLLLGFGIVRSIRGRRRHRFAPAPAENAAAPPEDAR